MSYRVTVAGNDIEFSCAPDESVLEAAERSGFAIPYSCRKGVCDTCQGELVSGEVSLPNTGVVAGKTSVLFCRARPRSDLEIQPKRIERREPPVRRKLKASVFRLTRAAPDVTILFLRFPIGVRIKFKAGQYLQVTLPDGDRRHFSMANPPLSNDGVELHIRHVPGGRFSEDVLTKLKAGDKLEVELPYGDFFLREESPPRIILLATGTGFAPIKSMIEDALKRGNERPMRFYWGARKREDLYLLELPQKWAEHARWLSFVPVLSEPDAAWRGRTDLVHEAVLADHESLTDAAVYACGNPLMIDAARDSFTARGLPQERFYADAFVPSGG